MSGVELIVGAVLGGIPVVLEAYDRYDKVLKAFKTFRHPSPELNSLGATLRVQKMLFISDITKLRDAVADDPGVAKNLLSENPDWAAFQTQGFSKARAECLRGLFNSWKENLDHVHRNLQVIEDEVEAARPDRQTGSPIRNLGRRFKLTFKKDKMQEAIRELRRYTYDFTQLTARIIDDLTSPKTKGMSRQEVGHQKSGHWNSLELYRQVQAASSCLYATFESRWSCAAHKAHMASITFCAGDSSLAVGNCVKLEASVRPSEIKETPLWLEVEYVDSAQSPGAVTNRELERNLVDLMDKLQEHTQKLTLEPSGRPTKKAKTVRFKTDTPPPEKEAESSPTPALHPVSANRDELQANGGLEKVPSPGDIEDVCKSFHAAPSGHCIAYDVAHHQHSGHCRLSRAAKEISASSQISLAEIITWLAEDEISRHLPRTSTAGLATSLSSAVLQYHSTPWLPDIWQSSHVRFYGISHPLQNSEDLRFSSPYFEVQFSKSSRKGKSLDLTPRAAGFAARNKILFYFGIILLELGYSRPWARLVETVVHTLPLEERSEYHVAEKLSRGYPLLNKMGPQFPVIVRKCLGCDFGTGESDLQNESLQGAFLVDVVCALQEIEKGLREIDAKLHGK